MVRRGDTVVAENVDETAQIRSESGEKFVVQQVTGQVPYWIGNPRPYGYDVDTGLFVPADSSHWRAAGQFVLIDYEDLGEWDELTFAMSGTHVTLTNHGLSRGMWFVGPGEADWVDKAPHPYFSGINIYVSDSTTFSILPNFGFEALHSRHNCESFDSGFSNTELTDDEGDALAAYLPFAGNVGFDAFTNGFLDVAFGCDPATPTADGFSSGFSSGFEDNEQQPTPPDGFSTGFSAGFEDND